MDAGPHLLGRRVPPNFDHVAAHPLQLPHSTATVEVEIPRPKHVYDQGQTPECVGYSSSKVKAHYDQYVFDGAWMYDQCKKIDPWPGQDGTSQRYACDVLRSVGHERMLAGHDFGAPSLKHGILSNQWCASTADIRAALAGGKDPVLAGMDWYDAWFTPVQKANGEWWLQPIAKAGGVAGGHEIGIWAWSDTRNAAGFSNTWGPGFPDLVWMAVPDLAHQLASGADACVYTDLPTR